MSFDNYNINLSADVATNGTFTVGYKAMRGKGSYANTWAHKMIALGAVLSAPVGFSVSFGATTATITYLGSTTLPAGTPVRLQFDRQGADDGKPGAKVLDQGVALAPTVLINLGSPILADADGISASQTVTGAGTAFLLNGAVGATLDVPRNVVAAWTNTAILTITGLDVDGNVVVEKSASGTSHTGKKAFKSITSVTTSATVTGATVGTGTVLGLPVVVPAATFILDEIKDGVDAIAPLTENSTTIGGSQDSNFATLAASVTWNGSSVYPSAADFTLLADAIREVAAKVNQLIATKGTVAVAVETKATATSGDVRGTYDPATAPDGTIGYALIAALPDVNDDGVPQYTG